MGIDRCPPVWISGDGSVPVRKLAAVPTIWLDRPYERGCIMKRRVAIFLTAWMLLVGFAAPAAAAAHDDRDGPNVFRGHFYQAFDVAVTWPQAAAFCEQDGGHLATITSERENQFVYGLLPTNAHNGWLGGSDAAEEGTWTWVTGEPFDYTNWAQHNPDNDGGGLGEDYLAIGGPLAEHGPAQWIDWQYDVDGSLAEEPFVCEYEPGSGGMVHALGGHVYRVFDVAVIWHEAVSLCEQDGGYLVTINSAKENKFVYSLATPWLGATDEAVEGTWEWVTGEPFEYMNWAPGQPDNSGDEDYLAYMGEPYPEQWNDAPASELNPFVCEYEPPQGRASR